MPIYRNFRVQRSAEKLFGDDIRLLKCRNEKKENCVSQGFSIVSHHLITKKVLLINQMRDGLVSV